MLLLVHIFQKEYIEIHSKIEKTSIQNKSTSKKNKCKTKYPKMSKPCLLFSIQNTQEEV
jgi:hypothetical protein